MKRVKNRACQVGHRPQGVRRSAFISAGSASRTFSALLVLQATEELVVAALVFPINEAERAVCCGGCCFSLKEVDFVENELVHRFFILSRRSLNFGISKQIQQRK